MYVTDSEMKAISHALTSYPHVLISEPERRSIGFLLNKNRAELDEDTTKALTGLIHRKTITLTERDSLRQLLKVVRETMFI